MFQTKRKIDLIVVHCAATKVTMDVSVDDIRRWHVEDRGWEDIGYHWYIKFDGKLYEGRPLEIPGAHARGHNRNSIGICLEGGIDANGKPERNYTPEQMKTLYAICYLHSCNSGAEVKGHRDFNPDKECPCFDVTSWFLSQVMKCI